MNVLNKLFRLRSKVKEGKHKLKRIQKKLGYLRNDNLALTQQYQRNRDDLAEVDFKLSELQYIAVSHVSVPPTNSDYIIEDLSDDDDDDDVNNSSHTISIQTEYNKR